MRIKSMEGRLAIGMTMALMPGAAHAAVTWVLSDYHAGAYANPATDVTTTLPGWRKVEGLRRGGPSSAPSPR